MRRANYSVTGMVLIVAMCMALAPPPARAGHSGEERPIRLYATTEFIPIGVARCNSFGPPVAAINGRAVRGEQLLRGGELLEALQNTKVLFDSIGAVELGAGAAVRFGTGRTASGESSRPVLIASIERGRITVELGRAEAYIEGAGKVINASPGARFCVRVADGHTFVETFAGEVRNQDPVPPQDVNIRIVDELGRPVSSGSQLSVRARSTRQIQVQVTDKNDKPLPDLPVLFSLGDPCIGSLGLGVAAGGTFRQKTDKRGIAAVPLVAGAARCVGSILAKVEGTNASVSIQTNVVQQRGFWNTQNTVLVAAAAAGVGIGLGLYFANRSNEPIRPVPPPGIKP